MTKKEKNLTDSEIEEILQHHRQKKERDNSAEIIDYTDDEEKEKALLDKTKLYWEKRKKQAQEKVLRKAGVKQVFMFFSSRFSLAISTYILDKTENGNPMYLKRYLFLAYFYMVAAGFPVYLFRCKIAKLRISPYIKERICDIFMYFIFSFWTGLFLFLFLLVISDMSTAECLITGIVYFFLISLIVGLFAFFLEGTVLRELKDQRDGYKFYRRKMTAGFLFPHGTSVDAILAPSEVTHIRGLENVGDGKYPVKIYGKLLARNHRPKTSLPQEKIIADYEYNLIFSFKGLFSPMEFTPHMERLYEEEMLALLSDETKDFFNELITAEPSMEFRYTYLRHSKLLVRIDPIEGYDYAEEVPALLEKLNATIHPWLKDKVKR